VTVETWTPEDAARAFGPHDSRARGSLREKIRAESEARRARYAEFAKLWADAHAAGMAAGNAVRPTPMVVCNGDVRINGAPLDPYKPATDIVDVVADGACGFAWVVVRPGSCSFARWAVKEREGRKEYGGGVRVRWVGEFNQSLERKDAYAKAFADVLRAAGINAYAHSRMD